MNEEAQAQAQAQNVNLWEDIALKDALIRLGLTDIGARKFMENGVTDVHRFQSLDEKALTRLIKIITHDHDGDAGLVIPFMAQEYIHAMLFWTHQQFALGLPFNPCNLSFAPMSEQEMEERRGRILYNITKGTV
jgi:hypothetical protein